MSTQNKLLNQAVSLLKAGALIGLPTETVYGLAGCTLNESALEKIFALKQRPKDHPLIVHISQHEPLSNWASDLPSYTDALIKAFWPGPLTLVLKKNPHISSLVTAGQDTVAIRSPAHPLCQQLLEALGTAVCAPSANRFGQLSPTSAKHVRDIFGDELFVLEGGPCEVGIESTILNLSSGTPQILRPGMISAEAIASVIERPVIPYQSDSNNVPVVPGSAKAHYAPSKPLSVVSRDEFVVLCTSQPNKQFAWLCQKDHALSKENVTNIIMPTTAAAYASELYQTLHQLEHQTEIDILAAEKPNDTAEWQGIVDRLSRASN